MDVEQALSVLEQVTAKVPLVRADNMAVLQSLAVVRGKIENLAAEHGQALARMKDAEEKLIELNEQLMELQGSAKIIGDDNRAESRPAKASDIG